MHTLSSRLRQPVRMIYTLLLCAISCFSTAGEDPTPAPLELLVIGSGGPGASERAGSGYVLLLDGVPRILVDGGPGSLVRLGESKLDLRQLDVVLLTHLHVDHVAELPGIVKARAVSARTDIQFQVFGPDAGEADADHGSAGFPSTRRYIDLMFGSDGAFSYLQNFAGTLHFTTTNLGSTQVTSAAPQRILEEDGLVIHAISGHHRDAPSVIYRVDYKGKSITFSGDIDAQGHAALADIVKGSTWLVFNAAVLDPPDSPAILYTLHTSPDAIGALSAAAGVSHLLLSHLAQNVYGQRETVSQSIRKHYQGQLRFAEDRLRVRL
jgi:ribonuclease BN (tRNA processing enzyme)